MIGMDISPDQLVVYFVYNEIQRLARLPFLHKHSPFSLSVYWKYFCLRILCLSHQLDYLDHYVFLFIFKARDHAQQQQRSIKSHTKKKPWIWYKLYFGCQRIPATQLTVIIQKTLACWFFTDCNHSPYQTLRNSFRNLLSSVVYKNW